MQRPSARQTRALLALVFGIVVVQWWSSSSSKTATTNSDPGHDPLSGSHPTPSHAWPARADQVKRAFLSAYTAYEKSAYPADELLPVAHEGSNSLNGWGLSVVDSIDTMVLMGLTAEYKRALEHVKKMRMSDTRTFIPFFETTIRYLGGLLSAYTLTSDPIFLTHADELGQILLPAFGSPTGLPMFFVNPAMREAKMGRNGRKGSFSETTSFILEFNTLARFTGRKEYADVASRATDLLVSTQPESGLWSISWDIDNLTPLSYHWAIGGNADSAYEYLLKQWLSDPKSKASQEMYIRSSNAIISNLLYLSPNRHLLYATDIPNYNSANPAGKLEHLTCFLPGLLALGVHTLHEHLTLRQRRTHMWAAEGLAQTCSLLYADSVTGLAPDEVVFSRWPKAVGDSEDVRAGRWVDALSEWERAGLSRWRKGGIWGAHEEADRIPPGVRDVLPSRDSDTRDYWLRRPENVLRPETIESLYILYKTTKDPKWRERGWEICDAFELHSRTPSGAYSSVRRVDSVPVRWTDSMPSWFLAETLKYCFLIASDVDLVPLDRYVFNTEGHPLPRWGWDGWKQKFPKGA